MQSLRALFKTRPLLANVVSFGSMYVGAELVQQTILQKLDDSVTGYDFPLVGRYAVIGTGVYAPALFYWYRYLDRVLPGKIVAVAVRKALIDQVFASSTLLVAFYTGELYLFSFEKARKTCLTIFPEHFPAP